MQVIRDGDPRRPPVAPSALAIGVFDGVHLGHRYIIGEARRLAAEQGARSVVVTFDRHPAQVVRPDSAPKLLTDLDQRLDLLSATGVECTFVVTFDEPRSKEAPEDFVTGTLVDRLAASAVVVGADFHFGHERRGDVELLRRMGAVHGFEVDGVELLASSAPGAKAVSSTTIRRALDEGDLPAANRMLGRHYEMRGTVVTGDHRGGELLGFPTANVDVPDEIQRPADGIYAGWYVRPDGRQHAAAISMGRRPTFYADAPPLLEAHLIDFSGDLYGERAAVRFVARLRGEERFDSIEALIRQMTADVENARSVLEGEPWHR